MYQLIEPIWRKRNADGCKLKIASLLPSAALQITLVDTFWRRSGHEVHTKVDIGFLRSAEGSLRPTEGHLRVDT